jgi:hypothetical protein
MKVNFFDVLDISKRWASDYGFKNVRTYEGETLYHINTGGIEVGFDSIITLASDLSDYETCIHSVTFDSATGCIVINIFK